MTEKRCLIFETLGKVSDLQVMESANKNEVRLSGVFGVCGVKNQNNRIYDKENYKQMVESLQQVIAENGCPGELEHPNSMNINLNNVSHKIESIEMNEDGTITGTILLLNTRQGQQAKAIVEGGLPLFISSRGAGTITNEGKVTLSTIKTYDLVGTPGFSQAKLTLKGNQKLECLNEGLDEGNETWVIVEGEDDNTPKGEDNDNKGKGEGETTPEPSKKEGTSDDDNNKNNDDKVDMNDLKEAIDKLTEKVESLEADLHVAKESIDEAKNQIQTQQTQNQETPVITMESIETWVKETFAPELKNEIDEAVDEKIATKVDEVTTDLAKGIEKWVVEEFSPEVQKWVVEEFSPEVQNWVVEEFAPEVQKWIVEEYSPEVQNWVVEEFSPEVQNWIVEEFAPEVQGWITEEFSPVLEGWVTTEFAPEHSKQIEEKVNESVSAYLAENASNRLEEIDSLLETIGENKTPLETVVETANKDEKYKGIYVVEHMPAQYAPSWQLLTEERQQEIIRSSKVHDFTKEGVLERFWANVDFNQTNGSQVVEQKDQPQGRQAIFEGIAAKMRQLRGGF